MGERGEPPPQMDGNHLRLVTLSVSLEFILRSWKRGSGLPVWPQRAVSEGMIESNPSSRVAASGNFNNK